MSQNRTEGNPCRHACHFQGTCQDLHVLCTCTYICIRTEYGYLPKAAAGGLQAPIRGRGGGPSRYQVQHLWCGGQQRPQRATSMEANAIRHRIRASVQVSRVDACNAPNCGKIAITILPWDMPAQGGWLCMVPRPLRNQIEDYACWDNTRPTSRPTSTISHFRVFPNCPQGDGTSWFLNVSLGGTEIPADQRQGGS
ncbi:hypothetical protein BT67DRAFT_34339 [Trichocladium antarcticum]|uniref:Uncharacterized protein n=1 Tax=Trichocladium antarcticum TaxID=1450529 RepID=A0AAN6ZDJ2_9PEZI|nr:hypothetical protein BT67DRAFT_34339 [Trichocladium antarcticum]